MMVTQVAINFSQAQMELYSSIRSKDQRKLVEGQNGLTITKLDGGVKQRMNKVTQINRWEHDLALKLHVSLMRLNPCWHQLTTHFNRSK